MESNTSIFNSYIKSSFYLNDKPIGKLDFINENAQIIVDLLSGKNDGRGIILHQGTDIVLCLAVLLSAYNVFLTDENDNTTFLDDLNIGDLVIYGDKRGEFLGIESDGKIKIKTIETGFSCTNFVPTTLAYKIKPYNGNARTLDGRGIKKGSSAKYKFLANLFGIPLGEIKNTFKKSIVIVCDKLSADNLMDNFKISETQKSFGLGDLFPTAYYTSSGEPVYYPGNSAKQDPLIKFVSKLSTARELIIEDRNVTTLLVNGSNHFGNDSSEIGSLYSRRSLKNIIMLGEMSKGINSINFDNYEDVGLYAWTKYAIGEKVNDRSALVNDLADESKRLYEMLNNSFQNEIQVIELEDELEPGIFHECKRALHRLSKTNIADETDFVIKGYSLLNLFQRGIFAISMMKKLIVDGKIGALSPSTILFELEEAAIKYADKEIGQDMSFLVTKLSTMMNNFYLINPKYECLKEIVALNIENEDRIAIVVPKNYYASVFRESLPESLKEIAAKIDFCTPNKFISSKMYDQVILVSVFGWNTLDPSMISNSRSTNVLIYKNERNIFKQEKLLSEKNGARLEIKNLIASRPITETYPDHQTEPSLSDENNEINVDLGLEALIRNVSIISSTKSIDMVGNQTADIVRVAMLETGERIYFTKHYTPYIFDQDKQVVIDSDVSSIVPGDLLIFTNYDSGTRDIVEQIIEMMIEDKKVDEKFKDCYRRSIYWKRILKDFMIAHRLSFKDLSDKMKKLGTEKHEVTLRTWLDEDNHIVGPRDSESFYAVASLTGDPKLLENPDSYHNACREVRSMRIRILRFIGSSIIRSYGKHDVSSDELLQSILEDISKMSVLVQVENVVDTNDLQVPTHFANRPISI